MPEFSLPIPITKPLIGESEIVAATRPLSSGWVTQGPEVAAFEAEFANYIGSKYACAVSNCTAALHLSLLALNIQPGDEVITVSHSFIATANSIRYCQAIPVFVDVDANTYNIDPSLIEKAISPKTKAILCVHQMGMPCDLSQIKQIASNHNLPIVEDAACAIGSEIKWDGVWEKIGKPHGDLACFSFHPRKIITTGDGGMITTNNSAYNDFLHKMRQHCMSIPDTVRHSANKIIFEEYPEVGYNYRMTDIQAAIGREQLKRLPEIIERRRYLANRYINKLSASDKIILPAEPEWAHSNWQSFCIQLASSNQLEVMQKLLDLGISTRRGIMCSHKEPAYANHIDTFRLGSNLINSEFCQSTGIILPLFHQLSESAQDYIITSILSFT